MWTLVVIALGTITLVVVLRLSSALASKQWPDAKDTDVRTQGAPFRKRGPLGLQTRDSRPPRPPHSVAGDP